MPAPVSLVDLDPDFFCSPSRSQWLREYRLALPWTQAQLADLAVFLVVPWCAGKTIKYSYPSLP